MRSTAPAMAMGGREWAMLLALAVLWGGSFFLNGVAVLSFDLVFIDGRLPRRNGAEARA